MDKIIVNGGVSLHGDITASGAKNSALVLYAAALLNTSPIVLHNVPNLQDMLSMEHLLKHLGANVAITGESHVNGSATRKAHIDCASINSTYAPYDLVRKMRASFLVLGPLLARFGEAKVSLPGGCAIGTRPVDLHLQALEKLGAVIEIESGYVHAKAKKLQGNKITFAKNSVGATEQLLMAAVLAQGTTELHNAALEPEIVDLAEFLNKMGAKINGHGTATIVIEGVDTLNSAEHRVIGDRIEAGTFVIAAVITGGKLKVHGVKPKHLEALLHILQHGGVHIETGEDWILVDATSRSFHQHANNNLRHIETAPYPHFPTDLQAQMMALLSVTSGQYRICENVFENRFMHVAELARLGAKIDIHEHCADIHGVMHLQGAEVMATDLRASVSLILAGLVAEGQTTVNRVYHLDRGYEHLEEKLNACGALIKRVAA